MAAPRGRQGRGTPLSRLEILALGFDPADPSARLPHGLVETGWPVLVQFGWPSDDWLARQEVDLFVLRLGGVERIAERTRTLGRLTGRPVLWVVQRGTAGAAEAGGATGAGRPEPEGASPPAGPAERAGPGGPGDPGASAREPEDLWHHLASQDWPVWTVLPADAPRWQVVAVCRALVSTSEHLRAARREVEEAARKLEDRKLIERAKGILMDRFELAESEAYRRLRETAMRQRKPLREIAQSIIEFAALERPAPPPRRPRGPGTETRKR